MKPATIRTALLAIGMGVMTASCGSSPAEPAAAAPSSTTATTTTTVAERPSQPLDELVRIDSGRMHLRCVGAGESTVLLIAGWAEGRESWGAIEAPLAEHARVCSYSRFGTGTSDVPSSTQTFTTQATDLHALLEEAGEPGPYLLVGHSFGGAEAVTFASRYSGEVRGLVLLDASPTTWPAAVCSVAAYEGGCAVMNDPALDPERLDVVPAFEEVATIRSLEDLPMTVVTAAHRIDPALAPAELARLDTLWAEGLELWAGLSTASSIVTVADTGHHIQIDQPQAVIDEVLGLLS